MRPTWILAALAALTAGPAFAQGLIPPSRQYSNRPPEALDKNYGLPTFGTPTDLPQKRTVAPKPKSESDSFKGQTTFAHPDAEPSDAPNFFQPPPDINAPETQTSDVPNFFETPPDTALPKAKKPQPGYATTDTPLFTTSEDAPTGETPPDRSLSGDTSSEDSTMGDTTTPDAAKRR